MSDFPQSVKSGITIMRCVSKVYRFHMPLMCHTTGAYFVNAM